MSAAQETGEEIRHRRIIALPLDRREKDLSMTMKTYSEADLEKDVERDQVAGCFTAAGVAVFPTETFNGLGGNPRSAAVLSRIARLKGRPPAQTVPLLAAGEQEAVAGVDLSMAGEREMWSLLTGAFWPGPLTVVARAQSGLDPGAVAADGTLAVRVPGHAAARTLASLCGGLLVATSANRSGRPPAVLPGQAVEGLTDRVDFLVDGGPTPGGRPSTLVAITGGRPRLLRQGAVSSTELAAVLGPGQLA